VAVLVVPLIALAGAVLLFVIAGGWPDFRAPYGALVAAKVAGFSLLLILAALNKLRLAPAIAAGGQSAQRRLVISLVAEIVLLGSILAVTAVMTTFYSP
jgi:putative copper resistance protein D